MCFKFHCTCTTNSMEADIKGKRMINDRGGRKPLLRTTTPLRLPDIWSYLLDQLFLGILAFQQHNVLQLGFFFLIQLWVLKSSSVCCDDI